MFQRRTRPAFPIGMILFMLILLLLILGYWLTHRTDMLPQQPEPQGADSTLRPAEWFYAVREYPDFRTDVAAYERALQSARYPDNALPRGANPGFSAPWTVEGPGNIGARINTVRVHPDNPDVIYAGYSGGGVWKTTDGGQNWFPIFDEQNFLAIGAIELDPQDPETVYIGTGDPNISGYPFIGDGLWKSTDGGQSWQHLGLEETRVISRVIVHPANSAILYVATMGLPFERNNDRGLYKSTDGGQTWEQILFVSNDAGVIDLEMDPQDPQTLYASVWDRIRNNQESVVAGNNARIWKSDDGGANWTMLGGGLPLDPNSRIGIAVDAQNGQHLIASYAGTNLDFRSVYESFDGGQTWTQNPANGIDGGFQGGFAWYFGKLYINPYNPDDQWILGVYTFRSTDGGQSWSDAVSWQQGVHADHHDLAFLSASSFLLATDGGLYRSDNDGADWFKAENIPATQFYRVAHNPFQPELYYGGAQDNGTLAGRAAGIDAWQHLYGGDGFQPAFHPENPDIFYYEWQNGNIVGTTDGGAWIDNATNGIEPGDRRHWDMQYIISRHDPDYMYTGTHRVYASVGHPPSWTPVSGDLTDGNIFGARYHTLSTLDESPLDPELLIIGTTDGNVWRGNPFTQTWTDITAGLPDRYVSSVKASPSHPDRLYVAHTGYKSNDFQPLLHRSDDLGETWTPISGDLPQLAINDLVILPGHQDSVLFVGTDGGVYGTLDGGQHWERLGAGMPFVPVYDLDLNPVQRTLFAGTHARSIWSFPLDSLQLGADVSTFTPEDLEQPALSVLPTLAQTSVQIGVEYLPVKHQTELWVCDLQGNLLWQGRFRGGQRAAHTLDVAGWPAGVYIAFARSGGKVWAQRKFVVVR